MSQRFRLAVVLRLREMAEDRAQLGLAQALAAHHEAVADVHRLQDAAEVERQRLSSLQSGGAFSAGQLLDASDAVDGAQRSLERGRDRLQTAAGELFQARAVLAEATRRREVVERFRDRFVAAQRREEDRREAAFLSEMGVTRHAWRALGEGRQ